MLLRMAKLVGVLGVVVVALELFLRSFHTWIFPVALSNEIATGYHAGWSGIYEWSPQDYMFRMRPDFSREMYFNGYSWQHQTDSRGLRHPREIDSAPIVLLGDSMIYGHGVDQEDTVREQLERILQVPVANLGVQGGSIHQELQLLLDPGLSLQPRLAILFFLKNDPGDLAQSFTEEEMLRVIRDPGRDESVYFSPRFRTAQAEFLENLMGLYTVRAATTITRLLSENLNPSREAHAAPRQLWRSNQEQLAMAFHNQLLRRLNRVARQNHIVLLHVFIDTGFRPQRERMFKRILSSVCTDEGIPFLDLGPVLEEARAAGINPLLPDDGHFSPAGARIVAEALADWITHQGIELRAGLSPGGVH